MPASLTKHASLEKDTSLEAILKPQELPTTAVTPISLAGVKIPGVTAATTNLLALNHFVVINNTNFETMGELYRNNRLNGKPNFVTLDSIVHPYFATTNGLIAAVIEEHATPELKQILSAMLKASVEDYRNCEDAEIKDDIQRNLAFLIVALRLLDPSIKLPDMGGASDLADKGDEKHQLRFYNSLRDFRQGRKILKQLPHWVGLQNAKNLLLSTVVHSGSPEWIFH